MNFMRFNAYLEVYFKLDFLSGSKSAYLMIAYPCRFNFLLYPSPSVVALMLFHAMIPFWFLCCTRITSSSVVAEYIFERIKIDPHCQCQLSSHNEFWSQCSYIRESDILFVYYQSWRVSLIRYDNEISAASMRVASSCTIWDLTSYQLVPIKIGYRYGKCCALVSCLRIFHGLFIYIGFHPVTIKRIGTCDIIFCPSMCYGKNCPEKKFHNFFFFV